MKKKIKFEVLFYNNNFVLAFSFVVAFITWIIVSSSSYEKYEKVISDIPVTIALSDNAKEDGLRVFSGADIKAEVTVSGNRIVLGMISKDNVQVIAKQASSSITSPGNYTLELTANKKGTLTDYEFSSAVSPNFITVSVDRLRQITLDIEDEIKYNSDPTYFAASTNFSETSVTISGPESKIASISKVAAKKEYDGILKSTKSDTVELTVYDYYGMEVNKDHLTMSVSEVDVVIPILFRKTINVVPEFSNAPEGLDTGTSFAQVDPSTMEIAGPEETVTDLEEVKLYPLDFSKISMDNKTFTLDVNLPSGCRTINNNYSATLKINLDKMKSKSISVSKITFINVPEGKSASAYTESLQVQMIGPSSNLSSLKESDVFAQVDLKDQQDYTGRKELPVIIKTSNTSLCWAYGDYTANVGIE